MDVARGVLGGATNNNMLDYHRQCHFATTKVCLCHVGNNKPGGIHRPAHPLCGCSEGLDSSPLAVAVAPKRGTPRVC